VSNTTTNSDRMVDMKLPEIVSDGQTNPTSCAHKYNSSSEENGKIQFSVIRVHD